MNWEQLSTEANQAISVTQHHAPRCIAKLEAEGVFKGIKGKVLDIGCGQSDIRDYISGEYHGLDLYFDFDFLEKNPWAYKGDMHENPFASSFFDNLLIFNTMEHSICPFVLFKEMARVLKPGGTVYALMPTNKASWDNDPYHWFIPSEVLLRRYFVHFGFEVKRFEEFPDDCWFIQAMKK